MRKACPFFAFTLVAVALSGCGGGTLRQQLGLEKRPPDEFNVITRAPLSLPPDYALRPPQPGAPRPQEQSPATLAQDALLGQSASPAPSSPASAALLEQAGAGQASESIRGVVDEETAAREAAMQQGGVRGIILRRACEESAEPVVSPGQERQRVQSAQTSGQPVTGQGAATRKPREQNFWQRTFGF